MTKDEVLKLMAKAIEDGWSFDRIDAEVYPAIKQALAQPEQEPVGYWQGKFSKDGGATLYEVPQVSFFGRTYPNIPLYTTPPHRKPLTDEEVQKCYETTGHYQTLRPQDRFAVFALARAIEAAHGIKEST